MPHAKPNVILVITDDQGYGDLGCHGNPVAVTPHMDAMHDESVRLADFHVAPMCTPTRGQLLTGLDAARNGAVNVSSGRTLLRPELPTMADWFRGAGYRTGIFGKWHLGDNYPFRPQDRGFDESLWYPSSHISSVPDYWENDYFDDVYMRNGARTRYAGYCTEVFFREAREWIDERIRSDDPFFVYLPTNAPHAPLFVPAEDREAAQAAFAAGEKELPAELRRALTDEHRARIIRFLAMIRTVDTELGRLRSFLAERGIDRDTILIFMTDNGSTFGPLYFNAGMRGGKITLWEGGHRVPCFIHRGDGSLGEPRDIPGLTEAQDILPTLLDLCGIDPGVRPPTPAAVQRDAAIAPENRGTAEGGLPGWASESMSTTAKPSFDGISLAAALRGKAAVPDRTLFINFSRMPYTDYPTPDAESVIRREGAAVLWRNWRLVGGSELYDLETDPHQDRNVIESHPEVARGLQDALDEWWHGVEPVANRVQRVVIGSDEENPMTLTACEWWDVFVDQQKQVRSGERKNSYWHLTVEQAGTYRLALRRWPAESGLALTEACAATDLTDGRLEAGVALPIAEARLLIDRRRFSAPVAEGEESATFAVDLDAGDVLLHTWFYDPVGRPICGAYYVEVERLDSRGKR